MNIAQIEQANLQGIPFSLKMADGDEFQVPHEDFIHVPPKAAKRRSHVVVTDLEGVSSFLSLLAITSITFKEDAPA